MKFRKLAGICMLGAALLMACPAPAAQAASRDAATPATAGDWPPVSGDTLALMQQINSQMASLNLSGLYAGSAPGMSPAVRDTLTQIQRTYTMTPAQRAYMNALLGGSIAQQEVDTDVYRYEQGVGVPNGHREY